MDLLHAQFNHGRLSLEEIKTCLGPDFGSSWPTLQKKFKQDENGLFFNERAENEKNKRTAYSESRRKNRTERTYDNTYDKDMPPHMENENRNRNKDEFVNEKSFGKSENLLLVPKMFEVFKKNNPAYPGSAERDYKPLLSIASFFCEIGKLQGSPDLHKDKVIEVWELVSKVISKDDFYKQKPLSTISNQIQEILQLSLNGKPTKNGKQNYGSPERGNELDRLFAERYGSGGSTTS